MKKIFSSICVISSVAAPLKSPLNLLKTKERLKLVSHLNTGELDYNEHTNK